MRAVKVILLGIFFSFVGFVILSVISIMRTTASTEPSHATGLSAVAAGILEALLSPITLLVILVAFGAAFLLVRKEWNFHSGKGIGTP
jgi:hypothetical protein